MVVLSALTLGFAIASDEWWAKLIFGVLGLFLFLFGVICDYDSNSEDEEQ